MNAGYQQDYSGVQMQAPQTPEMQHMMPMQQGPPMLPQMAFQQQPMQQPMQTMPMQGDHSPMMGQMQIPHGMPMQLPQMAMSQPQTPSASGASTPKEICERECLAILMPQASQFGVTDKEALAAQLQASADCQRYED